MEAYPTFEGQIHKCTICQAEGNGSQAVLARACDGGVLAQNEGAIHHEGGLILLDLVHSCLVAQNDHRRYLIVACRAARNNHATWAGQGLI